MTNFMTLPLSFSGTKHQIFLINTIKFMFAFSKEVKKSFIGQNWPLNKVNSKYISES
jgi:hypothetical protein